MKPPAWRQDRAVYPHSTLIQTRYHDEDMLGHINNIAQAAYFDEARSRMMREVFQGAGSDLKRVRIVTADVRVSYLGEVFHPDDVEVASGILRIGNASMEIGQAMFQQGRCVALCSAVFVQAGAEGSSPLAPDLRAALGDFVIREPVAAA